MLDSYILLSPAEKSIYELIVEGHTNAEIGKIMSVNENTVKFHVTNIFNKLNFPCRSKLIVAHWRAKFHTKGPTITLTKEQVHKIFQLPLGSAQVEV